MSDQEREMAKMNGEYADDKSKLLQNFIEYNSHNPVIRESIYFKKLMEIDVHSDGIKSRSGAQSRATICGLAASNEKLQHANTISEASMTQLHTRNSSI